MSLESILFNINAAKSDHARDKAIPLPQGVSQCRNIRYGGPGKAGLLDVYFPDGTREALPTIVSIHGGGYVYGSKEIYRRYGMDMARRGFSFVNFNYRLAPRWKFPAPLEDTNAVMEWIVANAAKYHLDPQHIILVGDSAGAQLASQYAAIATNADYAACFDFRVPDISIRALGLNCGVYDLGSKAEQKPKGLIRDYFGPKPDWTDPRFKVLEAITDRYPPTYIATAFHDFLRPCARPMYDFLNSRHVKCAGKCYGTEEDTSVGHVFHVNIALPEAVHCNDDECDFFRSCLK